MDVSTHFFPSRAKDVEASIEEDSELEKPFCKFSFHV
jgi:hypothetical protein